MQFLPPTWLDYAIRYGSSHTWFALHPGNVCPNREDGRTHRVRLIESQYPRPDTRTIMIPMLAVENLGKRYGDRWLFRGLNFQVQPGQCLVISGRNGSGKSTLVKTLAGLIPITVGKVTIDGERRKDLGYMALETQPYTNLTPLEHLKLFALMQGFEPRPEVLDEVGLTPLIHGKLTAGQMSSGMKARLKLALAIQSRPKVLILDEPGTALDETGKSVLRQVRDNQLLQGALIVATNDPEERKWATHELELVN